MHDASTSTTMVWLQATMPAAACGMFPVAPMQ